MISRPGILVQAVISGLFFTLFMVNFGGCVGCPYSFSGASVPPHLRTIAIPYTEDKSGAAEPGLREKFTENLTKKFIDDNNLKITDKTRADAVLETIIASVSDANSVISGGETVTSRRITVYVQAVFRDMVKKKTVYEKQFSNYGDYASSSGREGRNDAIQKAIEKITDDILLETVSGW